MTRNLARLHLSMRLRGAAWLSSMGIPTRASNPTICNGCCAAKASSTSESAIDAYTTRGYTNMEWHVTIGFVKMHTVLERGVVTNTLWGNACQSALGLWKDARPRHQIKTGSNGHEHQPFLAAWAEEQRSSQHGNKNQPSLPAWPAENTFLEAWPLESTFLGSMARIKILWATWPLESTFLGSMATRVKLPLLLLRMICLSCEGNFWYKMCC